MRRQGPDPCGSCVAAETASLAPREPTGGSAGFVRRIAPQGRKVREGRIRAIGMQAPGLSPPSARLALGSSAAGAWENSRENLPCWRGSPPSRSSGPAIRFLGRAAASADPAAVLPATTTLLLDHLSSDPCRPAEASTPAALKQRSHEPRCHSLEVPRTRQQRAWLPCEISVHKAAKAAQLIPSFLHRAIVIARPRKRGACR